MEDINGNDNTMMRNDDKSMSFVYADMKNGKSSKNNNE